MTACNNGTTPNTRTNTQTFTTAADFKTWLDAQPANNNATAPYTTALNVNSLGGSVYDPGSVGAVLLANSGKYVNLIFTDNTLTNIESNAFNNCSNLNGIAIPDSVTSIGARAFIGTAWLDSQQNGLVYAGKVALTYKGTMPANTSITLKAGTKGIADSAFLGRTGLTGIAIPDSVTNIGESAFNNCIDLKSVTIPNSVTNIGKLAFKTCTSLASVTIGNGVKSIEDDAFDNCTSLTSVTFQSAIPSSGFSATAFPGDLRTKFYTSNTTNGTPGTYKTTAPGANSTWTK
ncbi:MAG: leucine-rich repeat domain-containing protein [Treponema sp.]|nr:leucine-rich repeat domain-containing protein [Treponema sp.]